MRQRKQQQRLLLLLLLLHCKSCWHILQISCRISSSNRPQLPLITAAAVLAYQQQHCRYKEMG
jgi:hypothetical protein